MGWRSRYQGIARTSNLVPTWHLTSFYTNPGMIFWSQDSTLRRLQSNHIFLGGSPQGWAHTYRSLSYHWEPTCFRLSSSVYTNSHAALNAHSRILIASIGRDGKQYHGDMQRNYIFLRTLLAEPVEVEGLLVYEEVDIDILSALTPAEEVILQDYLTAFHEACEQRGFFSKREENWSGSHAHSR